jgi:thiol-disulfide isomerase/thioredoxin
MSTRRSIPWAATLLALLWVAPVAAYHEANEPSDGTVASFQPVTPPFALPGITFADGAGRPVQLADFHGKVVLLNLWATWCPPCVRELPALDRLAGRLAGADFAVVTLALDRDGAAQAAPFFDRLDITHLTLYVDPLQAIGEALPDDVLPASYFLDRQGRVVRYLRSYVDWDDPRADALVRELIAAE